MSPIVIYCQESSHESKRATVGEFHHDSEHQDRWAIDVGKLKSSDVIVRIGYDERSPTLPRYRLACPLCGLAVVARQERLHPLLDRAAEAGVSEIPLAVLAASL